MTPDLVLMFKDFTPLAGILFCETELFGGIVQHEVVLGGGEDVPPILTGIPAEW